MVKSNRYSVGWQVNARFILGLHKRDKALLESLQCFFQGVGKIRDRKDNYIEYSINSIKDLTEVIIPHFDKYPLVTQKRADYLLFREVVLMMQLNEHLTAEGLRKVVAIKFTMNRCSSEALKASFPDVVPVLRPLVTDPKIRDPNWLAGFVSAEGCFFVNTHKSISLKLKERTKLSFRITQHSRDEALMRGLIEYLDCGSLQKDRDTFQFMVQKLSDISNKIIPFLSKHRIQGVKFLDYQDWCIVAELMNNKAHLTSEGLDKIRKIKEGMNKGR